MLTGGINQRPDINIVSMGSVGPRHDSLQGIRQDPGPVSYKLPMRNSEPVVTSKIEVGPEIRDPRQAAEMRRTLASQGPVPRNAVCFDIILIENNLLY